MVKKILLSLLILIAATQTAQAEQAAEKTFNERKANLSEVAAVRFAYGEGTVRIVVDMTKKVEVVESYAENPSRMILDLKNSWLNNDTVKREIELKSLAAKKIRVAQFDPTTVRIVIETMADTKIFHMDGGSKGHRLVIDVGNSDFKANPELNKPDVADETLKAKQEAELKAKQEADLKVKQEAELKAKQEADLKAKQEADLKAKQEADLKAKQEADLKAQRERDLERRERELEQRERELKEKQEAELKAQRERELERRERELEQREREFKEKQEKELQAQREREQKEKEKQERELKKKQEREQQEKIKAQREREKELLKEKEKQEREAKKKEKDKKDEKKSDDDKKSDDENPSIKELETEFDKITALKGKKIVLDPGHGGNDAGAIGPTGVMEKTVTLKVALELRRLLEAEGAIVIMTRETDRTVSEKGAAASDIEELGARCDVANRNKADIFISIHADSFTRPEARGTTGYYYSKSTSGKGQQLADCIRRNLVEQLGTPSRGTQPCNFFVVKHTDMPATLIELGFISNKEEEKLLDSKEGVQKAAQGILDGIEDYFG